MIPHPLVKYVEKEAMGFHGFEDSDNLDQPTTFVTIHKSGLYFGISHPGI